MRSVNPADAQPYLRALVERAAAGEPVRIMRRGKAVVQITAIPTEREAIDPAALAAVTSLMPVQAQDSGTFVRTMRDAERY
jgi:antitoxin (DNA-binding transcriptional repressor) of toxin-antitoxin stability system